METKKFIEEYKGIYNGDEKIKFLQNHIVKTYIPTQDKINDCQRIINSSYYVTNPLTNKKELHITSISTYLLFTLNLINRYTDIDIDFSKVLEEYDIINEQNLVGTFVEMLPQSEVNEYGKFLEMIKEDVKNNEYYIGAFISKKLEDYSYVIDKLLEPVGDLIKNLDEKDIDKLLAKIKK